MYGWRETFPQIKPREHKKRREVSSKEAKLNYLEHIKKFLRVLRDNWWIFYQDVNDNNDNNNSCVTFMGTDENNTLQK